MTLHQEALVCIRDCQLTEANHDSWDLLQTIVDTVERTVQAFMKQQGVQLAYA